MVLAAVAAAAVAPSPVATGAAPSPLAGAGLAHPPASVVPRGLVSSSLGPAGADYPLAIWEPASPANYTLADRPLTNPITRIVIHVAEGGFASTYTWFRNPAAAASAHYVVSETGQVAQMVHDRDIAWHAGNWAYNETSIGIEHAGFTNRTIFPDAEYRASARLAAWVADTYLVPPDRHHVIGHSEVPDPFHAGEWGGADHHTDPGRTWNWSRYMAYLRLDAHDTYQQAVTSAQAPAGTFRMAVPQTDGYDLFARWPCGRTAVRVPVTIGTSTGLHATTADEAAGCGRWMRIGAFTLAAGSAPVRFGTAATDAAVRPGVVRIVEQHDLVAPSQPAVTATASETAIQAGWPAAHDDVGVGGYRVSLDGRVVQVGPLLTYTAAGLRCDTVHVVSVKSLDMVSNASTRDQVWLRTAACPLPPTALTATSGTDSVALSWTAPAAGLTYRIWVNGHLAATTTATAFTVTGLPCGVTRSFAVQSRDASGSVSPPSTAVVAATAPC